MAIRTLLNNTSDNTEITNSLKQNDEFVYAHLIKFERPGLATSKGVGTESAELYKYLTDASYNIEFDDGSTSTAIPPVANGTQTYVANKILKMGTVSETVKAKASNLTLTVSGTALGTIATTTFTFTETTFTSAEDLIDLGFAEGDHILFEKTGGANNNVTVRIDSFSNSNKTITFTNISGTIAFNAVSTEYNISLVSEEVQSLFTSKEGSSYGSFINREVSIYRAHLDPETGDVIGAPWLFFKGIISTASAKDDVNGKSTVSWGLTSHWGDFLQVNGRLTQDSSHRALNASGVPDFDALKDQDYAGDLGFIHSERGVSLLATYQSAETRYKTKKRGGLAGFFGGVRMVEYTEMVDREVDLRFNLSAKYLPVVYGVQKAKGIPVFADSGNTNPNKVYIAQAFCEGPIHGIYDFHVEDQPSVCINEVDSQSRNTGDASVLCAGRADKGDVLASSVSYLGPASLEAQEVQEDFLREHYGDSAAEALDDLREAYIDALNNASGGQGLIHESSFVLSTPIDTKIVVHTGKNNQKADSVLAGIAGQNGFKLQNELFSGSSDQYWGSSHKLLDTAYASMSYTISEGETTIPDIEAVIKGKLVECFNYDYSYPGTGTESDFLLGDVVTLHKTSDDTQIGSSVQIIDKWSFYNPEGNLEYRFRFSDNPQVSEFNFYMKSATDAKWYFQSYKYTLVEGGTAQALPTTTISSVALSTNSAVACTLNSPSSSFEDIASLDSVRYRVFYASNTSLDAYATGYSDSNNILFLKSSYGPANPIYLNGVGSSVSFSNISSFITIRIEKIYRDRRSNISII